MSRVRKPFKLESASGGAPLYHCSRCDAYKPADDFHPSSIARFVPFCKGCRVIQNKTSRHKDGVAVAAATLYTNESHRFGRYGDATTPRPTDLVREVFAAWDHKSAMSGATGDLRVRRVWNDLPLSAANAVPVTGHESRRMGRARTPETLLALFPTEAQVRLRTARSLLTSE
jgi:hypothetical protein